MAADCLNGRCFSRQRVVVRQQAVDVVQFVPVNYYYFVGAPLRQAAVAEYSVKQDPLWQEFQEFKKWKEGQGQEQPDPAANPEASIMAVACVRCHGGAKTAAGLDFTQPLTVALKHKMMQKVWHDEMPVKAAGDEHVPNPLTAEQKAQLFDELLGVEE